MSKSRSTKSDERCKTRKSKRNVDDVYEKCKDTREHMLRRPDMYIGSVDLEKALVWIYNLKAKENDPFFVFKEIEYSPGFYKIFDEILVNARDHAINCEEKRLEKCTMIKISINEETGEICIANNGYRIPVEMSEKFKMWIPEMIFGDLYSSSNMNDKVKRKTGGRNGIGAKATNTFSVKFEVEVIDSESNQKFYQCFSDNMSERTEPKISSAKGHKSLTKISFIPDFKRFHMTGFTPDVMGLFKMRAYDIAMNCSATVYFNEEKITVNSFPKYVDSYFPEGSEHKSAIDTSNKNFRVAVVYDSTDTMEHQTISFVNGIRTRKGGQHVEHVIKQVMDKMRKLIESKSKDKDLNVKPAMIKENLIFFIDAVIENPKFDSQTKDQLTTPVAKFGSTYRPSDAFINKIKKTGVIETIIANASSRIDADLIKATKGKGGARLAKLYPATKANARDGWRCTLILTEGDSAKAFAMSGLNVVGREFYGVFPLRGKLLNTRNATSKEVLNNEEIMAVIRIIGLEFDKEYTDCKGLRYGKIMMLTDQDLDGFHIKGLLINFIHCFWPSLLKIKDDGFLRYFVTPLIKVSKGKASSRKCIAFPDKDSFLRWKADHNDAKGWKIKYYKGLGTHDKIEARECFNDIGDKIIEFVPAPLIKRKPKTRSDSSSHRSRKAKIIDPNDVVMNLAFNKALANERKDWLGTYKHDESAPVVDGKILLPDFINKDLIGYSVHSTARAVPSIMDGMKPTQRKVYFACVKKNLYPNAECKVSQLQGYISEHAAYHHGEASLQETIIAMAQDFVGANNLNLLMPIGQFGSRMAGGKDSSSPRYIFTTLNKLGKLIFIPNDFPILQQQTEDGLLVEPYFYAPIIPMLLVNGTHGIGTGYSCDVEPCNIRDIYANILRILNGREPKIMHPWYRHFIGQVLRDEKGGYRTVAKYDIINNDTVHITELPIGIWTDDYKAYLDAAMDVKAISKSSRSKEEKSETKGKRGKAQAKSRAKKGGSKTAKKKASNSKFLASKAKNSATAKVAKNSKLISAIKSFSELNTEVRVDFTIKFDPKQLARLIKNGDLESTLKLSKKLKMTNMHLFDYQGKIKHYESYGAILKDYVPPRLELYQQRKNYLLDKFGKDIRFLDAKLRFLLAVVEEGTIVIFKNGKSEKRATIEAKLEELEFPKLSPNGEETNGKYDYLLNIPIRSLTHEEIEKLRQERQDLQEQLDDLSGKAPKDIWIQELEEFMSAYDKWEEEVNAEYQFLLQGDGMKKKKRRSKKEVEEKAEA